MSDRNRVEYDIMHRQVHIYVSDSENEKDSPQNTTKKSAEERLEDSYILISDSESDGEEIPPKKVEPSSARKPQNSKKNYDPEDPEINMAGSSKASDGNVLKPSNATKHKWDEQTAESRKKIKQDVDTKDQKSWYVIDLLAEMENIEPEISKNIVKMFKEEYTVPFISRYRRELTGGMTPDKLRLCKNTFDEILILNTKSDMILKNIEKQDKLTPELKQQILAAKTLDDLEDLYAPFKPIPKGSLYDRACKLGLVPIAENILKGSAIVSVNNLVKPVEGLETAEKVCEGIRIIMSHLIGNNSEVLAEVSRLRFLFNITLSCGRGKVVKSEEKDKSYKFENYFNFSIYSTKQLKPHQILAINRGEHLKVLTVEMSLDSRVEKSLKYFVKSLFLHKGPRYELRTDFFETAFADAFDKKITPLIIRQERAFLTKIAEKKSVEVFAGNLKQLLLLAPNRERILGIDPGFSNGCKMALISENGDVLATAVYYLHSYKQDRLNSYGEQLSQLLKRHNTKLIALGNGTACRETENWITGLYAKKFLDKSVRYCIVNGQGASIYSCSDLARKEFPNMDVNLISAVSIARRLFDPISEYVKIDSKHLGVGMYQHDIKEKILNSTLNEVVVECVSFVGVDINSASEILLTHVSGLSKIKADAINKHRNKYGPFKTRKDIMRVKGIGPVTFKNSAGFLRIDPNTAGLKTYNLLDSTWIHPESYDLAEKIIRKFQLSSKDIGKREFITKVKENANSTEELAEKYSEPIEKVELIIEALQREIAYDYRKDLDNQPLFKQGLTQLSDLKVGMSLTGAVTNITDFGSFVDIGVETSGLIHKTNMNGKILKINDRVNVKILTLDIGKGRISLSLVSVL